MTAIFDILEQEQNRPSPLPLPSLSPWGECEGGEKSVLVPPQSPNGGRRGEWELIGPLLHTPQSRCDSSPNLGEQPWRDSSPSKIEGVPFRAGAYDNNQEQTFLNYFAPMGLTLMTHIYVRVFIFIYY